MQEPTLVYLVRHGQTEWNTQRRFQGHEDSPLTELGVKQASWLGESMRSITIDVIYSSTSPRARRTAEIIGSDRSIPLHTSDGFKEIRLGLWEGMNQDEAKSLHPVQFHHFWNDPEAFQVQDAEAFQDVSERAVARLRQIVEEHAGKAILIVAHTVVVKLLMAYFENRALKDLWNPPYIHPTCLSKIEIRQDGHAILLHGDISHYKEETVEN
ncbi:histidine phosphatase family protein [Paenibacillus sacheonensis]|uniref:Histidine phosphatase family protein n=1 Tax=Paenibacillus sacheonensis TaxID=742054 RepID=A0A7X4YNE9_9BACL|nr:histidine phosphatase family protein [Paenibacillus sacheonensis]MBM7565545.1 putative phosphoglycerate mutase [Paenibacillus sacheonensis]NBC69535.1 histidine phosphatase family protein [Paenibacillus sacheonensis]